MPSAAVTNIAGVRHCADTLANDGGLLPLHIIVLSAREIYAYAQTLKNKGERIRHLMMAAKVAEAAVGYFDSKLKTTTLNVRRISHIREVQTHELDAILETARTLRLGKNPAKISNDPSDPVH